MFTGREASRPSGETDQLAAETGVCEAPGQRPATSGPRTVRPDGHRSGSARQPPATPRTDLPLLGRRLPCPGPAGRPGPQLLGLEPRRRRRAPNGQAPSERADSGARSPRRGGRSELARAASHPPPPWPRTLTPTYPVPHHPRGLRRSGLSAEAALPPVRGLKWLRNKENPGSGERRSDWPGGGARRGNLRRRSPWQRRRGWENCGLGLLACVGKAGGRAARPSGFHQAGSRGRRLGPVPASHPLAPTAAPTSQPGAQSRPPLPSPLSVNAQMHGPSGGR
jgi:hypothetical protein